MLKPLIFSSNNNQYLYDFIDNRIIYLTSFMRRLWDWWQKAVDKRPPSAFSRPDRAIRNSRDYEDYIEFEKIIKKYEIVGKEVEKLSNHIEIKKSDINDSLNFLSHLILKVTDFCNFECKYCIYSDSSDNFSLTNRKAMKWEIAKASIDYFFRVVNSLKRISRYGRKTISFYGGEPLLNFKLIRQCIEYIKNLKCNDRIEFNITTNASLINESVLSFLMKNDVKLLISIDGPMEENDKCRIDKEGRGTFTKVFDNIKKIKDINEYYFNKNVSFNAVFCEYHDLRKIADFFESEIFSSNKILVSRASRLNRNFKNKMKNYSMPDKLNEQLKKLKINYMNSVEKNIHCPVYISDIFSREFAELSQRKINSYMKRLKGYEKGFFQGCFPARNKLFVSTDGKFHVCASINNRFPIGDYKRGLNADSISNLLNKYYEQVVCYCLRCEAVNICKACFATFCIKDRFDRNGYCDQEKRYLISILKDYVSKFEKRDN